jgi:hypothetical protein
LGFRKSNNEDGEILNSNLNENSNSFKDEFSQIKGKLRGSSF